MGERGRAAAPRFGLAAHVQAVLATYERALAGRSAVAPAALAEAVAR